MWETLDSDRLLTQKKAAGVRAVLLNSLRWTTERKESRSISPHGRRLNTTVHSLQRLKTQSVLNQLWLTQKYIILSETGWEFIHLVFPGLLFAANWWWHLSIKKSQCTHLTADNPVCLLKQTERHFLWVIGNVWIKSLTADIWWRCRNVN